MSDNKKEIFDYLRNVQKAAEIEAKINGVNIWALLGAVALISWQLLGSEIIWDARNVQLILRTIVAAQMVYLLKGILVPPRQRKDDIRFFSVGSSGDPYMWILGGSCVWAPLILFGIHVEVSFLLLIPFVFGVGATLTGIYIVLKSFGDKDRIVKLPKPNFTFTSGIERCFALVAVSSFVWMFICQIYLIKNDLSSPNVAKSLALVAVLYLLILTIFDRKSQNHSIAWTYEMETDLLLGVITPDSALRRIEHQRLGPKLRDVVDAFCTDFESRFDLFDEALRAGKEKIAAVSTIPQEYPLERKGRADEAMKLPKATLVELIRDSERFHKYLKQIEEGYKIAELQVILKSLFDRHKNYEDRIRDARAELSAIAGSDALKKS